IGDDEKSTGRYSGGSWEAVARPSPCSGCGFSSRAERVWVSQKDPCARAWGAPSSDGTADESLEAESSEAGVLERTFSLSVPDTFL
ncbi:hypothetical protein BaRGS_00026951, partial [Batillaria attramentaria]